MAVIVAICGCNLVGNAGVCTSCQVSAVLEVRILDCSKAKGGCVGLVIAHILPPALH